MCYGMGCPWENHDGECTKPIGESCAIIDGWEGEEEKEEEDLLPDDEDALREYVKFLLKLGEQ